MSSCAENIGWALHARSPRAADVLGCTFRGGESDLVLGNGASGRIGGCDILGLEGDGVRIWGAGASPLLARNTIRNCRRGMRIRSDVGPSWTLGGSNVFTNCAEGDVVDERVHPPLPPPGPPA